MLHPPAPGRCSTHLLEVDALAAGVRASEDLHARRTLPPTPRVIWHKWAAAQLLQRVSGEEGRTSQGTGYNVRKKQGRMTEGEGRGCKGGSNS